MSECEHAEAGMCGLCARGLKSALAAKTQAFSDKDLKYTETLEIARAETLRANAVESKMSDAMYELRRQLEEARGIIEALRHANRTFESNWQMVDKELGEARKEIEKKQYRIEAECCNHATSYRLMLEQKERAEAAEVSVKSLTERNGALILALESMGFYEEDCSECERNHGFVKAALQQEPRPEGRK